MRLRETTDESSPNLSLLDAFVENAMLTKRREIVRNERGSQGHDFARMITFCRFPLRSRPFTRILPCGRGVNERFTFRLQPGY